MISDQHLGELEQLILLAALRAGDRGTAREIREMLAKRAHRRLSRGAVYHTLDRLEAKGHIASTYEEADDPTRGGHPRRRFQVTASGRVALRRAREVLRRMWDGLDGLMDAP